MRKTTNSPANVNWETVSIIRIAQCNSRNRGNCSNQAMMHSGMVDTATARKYMVPLEEARLVALRDGRRHDVVTDHLGLRQPLKLDADAQVDDRG